MAKLICAHHGTPGYLQRLLVTRTWVQRRARKAPVKDMGGMHTKGGGVNASNLDLALL